MGESIPTGEKGVQGPVLRRGVRGAAIGVMGAITMSSPGSGVDSCMGVGGATSELGSGLVRSWLFGEGLRMMRPP